MTDYHNSTDLATHGYYVNANKRKVTNTGKVTNTSVNTPVNGQISLDVLYQIWLI